MAAIRQSLANYVAAPRAHARTENGDDVAFFYLIYPDKRLHNLMEPSFFSLRQLVMCVLYERSY